MIRDGEACTQNTQEKHQASDRIPRKGIRLSVVGLLHTVAFFLSCSCCYGFSVWFPSEFVCCSVHTHEEVRNWCP